jgi:SAM-dependent methyltransferase
VILAECPDVSVTVCELDNRFEERLKPELQKEFGQRIQFHVMQDFTDWTDDEYDLVLMFEVIEHMPDDLDCALALAKRVAPNGSALVSTPVGYKWIEPPRVDAEWHPHVRAYEHDRLQGVLLDAFGEVTITEGYDRVFVAECKKPR